MLVHMKSDQPNCSLRAARLEITECEGCCKTGNTVLPGRQSSTAAMDRFHDIFHLSMIFRRMYGSKTTTKPHTHTSTEKFHSSEYQMENVIKFKVIYSNSSPPRHQSILTISSVRHTLTIFQIMSSKLTCGG